MYEDILTKAGLTQKQAKLYLACLQQGKTTAPAIARAAGVKRTTAYGILDELVGKGLVSYAQSGKTRIYQAQDPQVFLEVLETNKKEITSILPDLVEIFSTHHLQPRIQFFEGDAGIKRIYEDTLKCQSKKIQQIVRVRDFIAFPGGDFSRDYIRRRAAKGITAYALHPASGDLHDKTYGEESEMFKRHVRYLPPSIFYASMIMIYDDKLAMVSTRAENFGFIIESREFASTMKAYFEFLWKLGSKSPQ